MTASKLIRCSDGLSVIYWSGDVMVLEFLYDLVSNWTVRGIDWKFGVECLWFVVWWLKLVLVSCCVEKKVKLLTLYQFSLHCISFAVGCDKGRKQDKGSICCNVLVCGDICTDKGRKQDKEEVVPALLQSDANQSKLVIELEKENSDLRQQLVQQQQKILALQAQVLASKKPLHLRLLPLFYLL